MTVFYLLSFLVKRFKGICGYGLEGKTATGYFLFQTLECLIYVNYVAAWVLWEDSELHAMFIALKET